MKKIGIALGGGGARGIAHLAYLNALEELDVKPSIISGTSIGAIIGALYAGGMSPDEMYGLLKTLFSAKKTKKSSSKRLDKIPGGIIASFARRYLNRVLPKSQFEELDIPLKIVATNFNTLEERVFEQGDILNAVMCSIALPGVFAPQKIDDSFYIDGGATNIVPFDIIREYCDVLIAIDVSKIRTTQLKPSIKNSILSTWAATQETILNYKLKENPVEIFERPDLNSTATLEFYKYKRVYATAQDLVPEFKTKLKKFI